MSDNLNLYEQALARIQTDPDVAKKLAELAIRAMHPMALCIGDLPEDYEDDLGGGACSEARGAVTSNVEGFEWNLRLLLQGTAVNVSKAGDYPWQTPENQKLS